METKKEKPIDAEKQNLFSLYQHYVAESPHKLVLTFLEEGEVEGKKKAISWQELDQIVSRVAVCIQEKTTKGDRVALICLNPVLFIAGYLACLGLERIVVPIAPPAFATLQADITRISNILADCSPSMVFSENLFQQISSYMDKFGCAFIAGEQLLQEEDNSSVGSIVWELNDDDWDEDAIVMLQYTSGSTGFPKGVMLSHKNLNHNICGMQLAFAVSEQSVFFSWLPLFHDYGLIATLLTSIRSGAHCILMLPFHFMQKPLRWLQGISAYQATHSSAPNFAYELCLRKITAEQLRGVDLSSWKMAGLGGETIQAATLQNFFSTFKAAGFAYNSFHPQYGLAESTVGVACKANIQFPPTILGADKEAFYRGVFQPASATNNTLSIVGVGRTWLGTELRIRNPDTLEDLQPGQIGEIWLSSRSVSSGYWNKKAANFVVDSGQSWLRTGDLGFVFRGEVFICGRKKETIIVHGQNYWPADLEQSIIKRCSSVRKGGVCAVQDRNDELYIICELVIKRETEDVYLKICQEILHSIVLSFQIKPDHILLVSPRTILKTTSGKIRRHSTLQKFQLQENASLVWYRQRTEEGINLADLADRILSGEMDSEQDERSFTELGLDSLQLVELSAHLSNRLLRDISAELLFSYPTPRKLRAFVEQEREALEQEQTERQERIAEPIAVVGIGCRFPDNIEHIDDFWSALLSGQDFVQGNLRSRWGGSEKLGFRSEGFLNAALLSDDIFEFDDQYFNLSENEILFMDPQQRLGLELAWQAFEAASMPVDTLQEKNIGVFFSSAPSEYSITTMGGCELGPYSGSGVHPAALSGRISYLLGLQGPSVTVDTACSSSLMALHLACQSLRLGDCDSALVGAVNLLLRPESSLYFSQLGALSPSGKSSSFSDQADGYARGEGGAAIVLKRYSDAVQANDQILGLIRSTATNHDGASNGFTAPSGRAQQQLYLRALQKGGLEADDIVYIESHGTGTRLGDAIEAASISAVYGKQNPIILGAVKSNIGHLEAAAGLVGLIKVLKILQHQVVPPNLHCRAILEDVRNKKELLIPQKCLPISGNFAALSGFGFTGSNVHVILEKTPQAKIISPEISERKDLFLSGNSREVLQYNIGQVFNWLKDHPNVSLKQLASSLHFSRPLQKYRTAISLSTLQNCLSQKQEFHPEDFSIQKSQSREIAFLFSGQGSCYAGMEANLMKEPAFRQAFEHCHDILGEEFDLLARVSGAKEGLMRTKYTQASLLAFQYSLVKLWEAYGIVPKYLLGHSVGSYCAGVLMGAFSIKRALKLLQERGKAMEAAQEGAMLAIRCEASFLEKLVLEYQVDLCVVNGEERFVLGGNRDRIHQLYDDLRTSHPCVLLSVNRAFHSSDMKDIDQGWLKLLPEQEISFSNQKIWISDIDGSRITESGDINWWSHAANPINFQSGAEVLLQIQTKIACVEIGPQRILASMIKQACFASNSARSPEQFWSTLRELYLLGLPARGPKPQPMSFPLTKFYRKQKFQLVLNDTEKMVGQKILRGGTQGHELDDWIHAIDFTANGEHIWRPLQRGESRFFQNMTCVISGATGGLGRELARYLSKKYQANLILLHRRTSLESEFLQELQLLGGRVQAVRIDFLESDEKIEGALLGIQQPVDVLFHLAGVVSGDIHRIKVDSLEKLQILRPKYQVLFSSISSVVPSLAMGIEEYARANSSLNDFARRMCRENRQVQAICWGPWADVGMGKNYVEKWKKRGIDPIYRELGMEILEAVSCSEEPVIAAFYRPKQGRMEKTPSEIQQELCHIVSKAAKIEPEDIDIHQHFTELGIDSLVALDMLKEIEQFLGYTLPTSLIYENMSIEQLTKALLQDFEQAVEIQTPEDDAPGFALLPAQEAFIVQHQFFTDMSSNVSVAVSLYEKDESRTPHILDKQTIDEIMAWLLLRHPILTAAFRLHENKYRMELGRAKIQSEALSDSEDEESVVNSRLNIFEGPLFRCILSGNRIILIGHHAIIDAWSIKNIFEEILRLYCTKLKTGRLDFHTIPMLKSGWKDVLQSRAENTKHLDFWREKLQRGVPPVHLSWQSSVTEPSSGGCRQIRYSFTTLQTQSLRDIASSNGLTMVAIVLGAYKKLLFEQSGQSTISIRVAKGNREFRIPDYEKLVGSFADSLPIITDVDQGLSLVDIAKRTQDSLREALKYGDISSVQLAKMGEFKSCGPSGLTPFGFSFPNMPVLLGDELNLDDCRGYTVGGFSRLTLLAWIFGGELHLTFNYATSHLSASQVQNFMEELVQSLKQPNQVETQEQIQFQIITRCFQHPDRLAVGGLTYGQLNRRSAYLASKLEGERIAILGVPSEEAATAILAVLRTGRAWVPLDPRWPEKRIMQVLGAARPSMVLTTSEYSARLQKRTEIPIVLIGAEEMDSELSSVQQGDIAYIMYTSGSTGRPKGVLVRHPSLLHWLGWLKRAFQVNSDERFSWSSSLSFGGSLRQLFSPLQNGGQTIPVHPSILRNPSAFLDLIEKHQITNFNSVPSLLSLLLDESSRSNRANAIRSLRWVLIGGEAFSADLARKWFGIAPAGIRIFNVYGSTETIVNATAYEIIEPPKQNEVHIPIGWARNGCSVQLQNIKDGVGDIRVSGHIAEGYWEDEEETTRAFGVEEHSGHRSYLMGDIGKIISDGSLVYLGRRDTQVQIYGNRVELSEIEHRIVAHHKINECAVIYDGSLIAFVSIKEPLLEGELREYVQKHLPDYMVPHKWEVLSRLPRNTAGKILRGELRAEGISSSPTLPKNISPKTSEIQLLSSLWQRVLELPNPPASSDNFFTLGGDSIRVLQLQQLAEEQGYTFSPMLVYTFQTLESLALVLEKKTAIAQADVRSFDENLTMVQRGFWTSHQLHPDNPPVWASQIPMRGKLNPQRVQKALEILVQRHESLRTSFTQEQGQNPKRAVQASVIPQLQYDDISIFSEELKSEFLELIWKLEKNTAFDLETLPLFRVRLVKTAEDSFVLGFSAHHIIADAWSSWILISEMLEIHELLLGQQQIQLPETISFSSIPEPMEDDEWWSDYLQELPSVSAPAHANIVEDKLLLSSEEWEEIVERAKLENCTPFVLVLYALFESLQQILAISDISISTALAGREHDLTRLFNVVGPFARALPLRLREKASISLVKEQLKQVSGHSQASLSSIAKAAGSQGLRSLLRFFFSWMDPSIVMPAREDYQILWSEGRFSYDTSSSETELLVGGLVENGLRLNFVGNQELIIQLLPIFRKRLLTLRVPISCLIVYAPAGFPVPKGIGPILIETIQSSFGRMEVIGLPRSADNLGTKVELVPEIQKAARLSSAGIVALAGMLPALTGLCVDEFLPNKQLTTGHGVTVVAMFLNIKKVLETFGLDWKKLRVGCVGYGSIGTACLELLRQELGEPFQLSIEDPKLGENSSSVLGAQLIIGASSGGVSIDVQTLPQGTIIVDDSFPSIFDAEKALERMKNAGDVLLLGGGTLDIGELHRESPFPQAQKLREVLGAKYLPGCQIEAILLALKPELGMTRGIVTYERAKIILDAVESLELVAPPLHLGAYDIEESILQRFRSFVEGQ